MNWETLLDVLYVDLT